MTKKQSYSELAYTLLRRRILTLEYAPGTRLDDYAISDELKVSRTPVREAIFRLGAEGWVDVNSKAGFIVRSLDLNDIAQLFEAHIVIAATVARMAAFRITAAELEVMKSVADEIHEAIQAQDHILMTAKNNEFHQLEAQATRNQIIVSCAASIQDQSERLAYLCYGGTGEEIGEALPTEHLSKVVCDHEEMLNALAERNADLAEEIAIRHVRLFRSRVQDYIARETSLDLKQLIKVNGQR